MNAEFRFLTPKYIELISIIIFEAIFYEGQNFNSLWKMVMGRFLFFTKNFLMDFVELIMDMVNDFLGGRGTEQF